MEETETQRLGRTSSGCSVNADLRRRTKITIGAFVIQMLRAAGVVAGVVAATCAIGVKVRKAVEAVGSVGLAEA
jgi:hypothetical protein